MHADVRGYDSRHADIPALIMGNGPSLRRLDFAATDGYATFGMNAAYRHWQAVDWWPDYYSCLDLVLGESHRDAIAFLATHAKELGIRQLLLRDKLIRSLGKRLDRSRVTCYEKLLADGVIPKLKDITTGSHTLLWAESLGYTTVLLAGVDCNYVERVPGSVESGGELRIAAERENPNYFFSGYQRPGDRYSIPNPTPDLHVRSWQNAAAAMSSLVLVINLNHESKLKVFDRNRSDENLLQPGERIPGLWVQDPESRAKAAARFARTVRRLERQVRTGSPTQASNYLDRHLKGEGAPAAIRAWRQGFGGGFLEWCIMDGTASPDNVTAPRGPSDRSFSVVLRFKDASGAESQATRSLVVRLLDHSRIDQFERVITSLLRHLENHLSSGGLLAAGESFLRTLWRLLPWRIRAKDVWRFARAPAARIAAKKTTYRPAAERLRRR